MWSRLPVEADYLRKLDSDRSGGRDGCDPVAPLILDAAGNLYGTAIFGGKWSGSGV